MLSKKNRLHKDKDIKTVFAKGRGFFSSHFLIKRQTIMGERKFTFVVSTKVSKKAVVRNRIKRLLREVVRVNINKLDFGYYIVTVKPKVLELLDENIASEFLLTLEKLNFIKK